MGKTTLFHPVPLSVIRGAAEYSGWKFGRIERVSHDFEGGWARYTAQIEVMPQRVENVLPVVRLNDLRDCFAADIEAHWLRQTKSGKWVVDLVTHEKAEPENVV